MDTPSINPIHHPEVAAMRLTYNQHLLESELLPDPFAQFEAWFADARATVGNSGSSNGTAGAVGEPNAMNLATASKQGRPSSRMVLLKDFDQHGFVFYTNYGSRKAKELDENPFAALTFYWGQRSVRIEGPVERVSNEESDAYFASRPLGSRIGAWASPQSTPLHNREELDALERDVKAKFETKGESIPRPDFWGGFRVVPDRIEFWAGRASRLHDRIVYARSAPDKEWEVSRLAP
ncbi:hypothetical protein HDU90_002851 [Geranomyces variabilis]|nr:hypothetical protein HDU90_002851 [Geranomyces variabilis]